MTDFLEGKLNEIAPVSSKTATAPPKRPLKTPGRPAGKRRAGRRKGSGTRAAEALSFVQGQPGITVPELASKMSIKQNYPLPCAAWARAGNKVTKQGRGWAPQGLVAPSLLALS